MHPRSRSSAGRGGTAFSWEIEMHRDRAHNRFREALEAEILRRINSDDPAYKMNKSEIEAIADASGISASISYVMHRGDDPTTIT